MDAFRGVMDEIDMKLYGHDIKDSLYMMMRWNIGIKEISFDTSIAEYCLDVSRKDYSLKSVCLDRLGMDPDEMTASGRDQQISMFIEMRANIEDYIAEAGLCRALKA